MNIKKLRMNYNPSEENSKMNKFKKNSRTDYRSHMIKQKKSN